MASSLTPSHTKSLPESEPAHVVRDITMPNTTVFFGLQIVGPPEIGMLPLRTFREKQ